MNCYKKIIVSFKYGLLIGCHQGLNTSDISYIHSKITDFIKQ